MELPSANRALTVATVMGTRPEMIRLSRVAALLDQRVNHILVHTGQNYDYELNEIFYGDLGLRRPDRFWNVDVSSLGLMLGSVLAEAEKFFQQTRPDALLVLGDTNSAIAAIMARRMQIPIYHMEAGNRCFDLNVPEETNRKIIDHISDFNLVYTERARTNLLREGIHPRTVYLTGSPMREILTAQMDRIKASQALGQLGLTPDGYFLASLHREENVDIPNRLVSLITSLNMLAEKIGIPIVVSTHPRTRKRLEASADIKPNPLIRFLKPFAFSDYVRLQMESRCVISDSGTISEESAILGFAAVTPRTSTERPEALDAGSVTWCGIEPSAIVRSAEYAAAMRKDLAGRSVPEEYMISDCSRRVVNLIVGTAGVSNVWNGVIPRA